MTASQHPLCTVTPLHATDPVAQLAELQFITGELKYIEMFLDVAVNPLVSASHQLHVVHAARQRAAGLVAFTQPWADYAG